MGSTTLRPVRRSLVADSCCTSALLRSWLYATASDVTLCLGHVRLLQALHVVIMEHFADKVPSQRIVEVLAIQVYNRQLNGVLTAELAGELSVGQVVDGHLKLLLLEWQGCPRLFDQELLGRPLQLRIFNFIVCANRFVS